MSFFAGLYEFMRNMNEISYETKIITPIFLNEMISAQSQ